MNKNWIWTLGKVLEGIGLVVVLAGVLMSINLGLGEQGLASMSMEFKGLMVGGGLFLLGWILERSASPK